MYFNQNASAPGKGRAKETSQLCESLLLPACLLWGMFAFSGWQVGPGLDILSADLLSK